MTSTAAKSESHQPAPREPDAHRALIVDDEPLIAMYLCSCLERLGFRVSSAGSAAEALSIAAENGAFGVAFIDLGLPDQSGLELIASLRAKNRNLPVVVASGYGDMALRDADGWRGPVAILPKPFDENMVADALGKLGLRGAA